MVVQGIDLLLALVAFVYLVLMILLFFIVVFFVGTPPLITELIDIVEDLITVIRSRISNNNMINYISSTGITSILVGVWSYVDLTNVDTIEYPPYVVVGSYISDNGEYIHIPGDTIAIPSKMIGPLWVRYT